MDIEQKLREALTPCGSGPEVRAALRARLSVAARPVQARARKSKFVIVGALVTMAAAAAVMVHHGPRASKVPLSDALTFESPAPGRVATSVSSEGKVSGLEKSQRDTPVAAPEVPDRPALSIPSADFNPRALGPGSAVRHASEAEGYYQSVRSIDLRIYYFIQSMGSVGINPDGTPRGAEFITGPDGTPVGADYIRSMLARLQERFGLNDQEFEKLLDVAWSSLQSDRNHQSEQKAQMCAARATFRNIEDLGAAMNNRRRKVLLRQEELGREAVEKLGPELFSKIEPHALKHNSSEGQGVDSTIMLVAQRRDLATEIKRSCGD